MNSAANSDTMGAFGGIASIQLSALEPAAEKMIPVIGTIFNFGQTVRDWNNIPEDYNKCMSGGG